MTANSAEPAGVVAPKASDPPLWLRLAPLSFVLMWSAGYTAVKVGLPYIEPIFFLAVRYACVIVLLAPAYLIVRPPLPASRSEWLHTAIVGVLIHGLYFACANSAIALGASAAALNIILALQPILVALLAPAIASEKVGSRAWAGLSLGLIGAVIVILARAGSGTTTASGVVTAFFALLFITIGTLWEKRYGTAQHPIVSNLIQCGAALVVSLIGAFALESCRVTWSWTLVLSMAYLVIFNSIIAMSLLLAMIRHGAASRVSALLFLVPPGSATVAWLAVGEPLPPVIWIGMLIAGAGVALVGRPLQREPARPAG